MTRRRAASVLAGLALVAGLAGCGDPSTTQNGATTTVTDGYGGGSLMPAAVNLPDGRSVQCVALIGYRKGGVTCDWSNAK